jgi:HEAT repeat protein
MRSFKTALFCFLVVCVSNTGWSDAQVRIHRATVASDIPAEVKEKIERLNSPDPAERGQAAYELGQMGQHAVDALPYLIETLGDAASLKWIKLGTIVFTTPGEEALFALAKIDRDWRRSEAARRQISEFIRALGDEGPKARRDAAWALGRIADTCAVQPLIHALKDRDYYVRSETADALGTIGDHRATNALIMALQDETWFVRRSAAWSLGHIGDPRAVEPLIVTLGDDDSYSVRSAAADALGQMGDRRQVQALVAALHDENYDVRKHAAQALGKIGDTSAVAPLIAILGDSTAGVEWDAMQALKQITGQDFGQDITGWQMWWKHRKEHDTRDR